MEKKRGNIEEAIGFFELSKTSGRKGGALKRELASCYFITGDLKRSAQYLDEILPKNLDDRFIVDFSVQLATKQRDEPLARERLTQLALIDARGFYLHRLSRVELSFGYIADALVAAKEAVQVENRPSFEMLAQVAACEMKVKNYSDSEHTLAIIDSRFPNLKLGIRVALRALLEIKRAHFSNALIVLEKHPDKRDRHYKKLRLDSLVGEIQASAIIDSVRSHYTSEISRLKRELSGDGVLDVEDLLER